MPESEAAHRSDQPPPPTPDTEPELTTAVAAKTLALYTGLRVGIFAVCFAVLWLIFRDLVRTVAIVALALLIAGIVSLLALRRQSGRAGRAMARLRKAAHDRYEAARAAEDVDEEDARADGGRPPGAPGEAGRSESPR